MKEYIGKMVEVSNSNKHWEKRELLAVLPDDIKNRYTTRHLISGGGFFNSWKYARPIKEEELYYYQYEYLDGKVIRYTNFIADSDAKDLEFTEENGYYKIESSKRMWEH